MHLTLFEAVAPRYLQVALPCGLASGGHTKARTSLFHWILCGGIFVCFVLWSSRTLPLHMVETKTVVLGC